MAISVGPKAVSEGAPHAPAAELRPQEPGNQPQERGGTPRQAAIPGDDPRVLQAQRGDAQALAALAQALLPRVRNLVRYLVKGDDEVDDHAQASLIEILRGLPHFRGDSALTTWADRVTVRQTLRRVRRRRTERAHLDALAAERPQRAIDPTERYAARRRAVALLDRLPEAQREVLVLHHVVDMSTPEIASLLDVPFDTVKSRLRLAVKKLRGLDNAVQDTAKDSVEDPDAG